MKMSCQFSSKKEQKQTEENLFFYHQENKENIKPKTELIKKTERKPLQDITNTYLLFNNNSTIYETSDEHKYSTAKKTQIQSSSYYKDSIKKSNFKLIR
jgi:hypothetical protein